MCEGAYKCAELTISGGDPQDPDSVSKMGLYYASGDQNGHPNYHQVGKRTHNTMHWTDTNGGTWVIDEGSDDAEHDGK